MDQERGARGASEPTSSHVQQGSTLLSGLFLGFGVLCRLDVELEARAIRRSSSVLSGGEATAHIRSDIACPRAARATYR